MNRHSAAAYLYDETPVTSIAFETAEPSSQGLIIWGRLTNILQWRAEPFTANATLRMLPLPYNLCVKGEVSPQSRQGLYQANTLCLQGYKKYLQLRLAQQRIANVLLLSAEQVEVLSAQGEDAYHHGIQLSNNVTRFAITVIGNLRIMQGKTHLFMIGENPDNTSEIRYTKNPGMPYQYQLVLATLQPVVETLHQPNPQERHFTTPGLRYAWVAGEPAATLQIVGHYQGQLAQLLLEKDQATLSQPGFNQLARTVMVFHYTDLATLDYPLILQQVIPANDTRQQGPGLRLQSLQGDEVLHYFEHDRFTINGIHYQVHGQQLYATGADSDVIEGKQLLHYRQANQGVSIRLNSPLNRSVLSRDNQTLSINQLKLHQLPERTLIYFEQQAFPWKALQEAPHRHRHHHRTRRQLPDISSSASRPTPWITLLWQELRGILAGTNPRLPQAPLSRVTPEYTSGHLQGGLQLLDLVIRKCTGQKYSPPALTQNVDDQQRTAAAELAYAAYRPVVSKLKQSLTAEVHESQATTPQEPWLAYPPPTTDTHHLTHQLT